MNISYHTLYWANTNSDIVNLHKKIMKKFDIDVHYTEKNIHHGQWIDEILEQTKNDAVIFMDIDCFPLSKDVIDETVSLLENDYMVGNAQVTNCIKAKHDLFCAPSYLGITKKYYEKIGKPSAVNNGRSDIAQELTRAAIDREMRLKMYFPTSFQSVPQGGIWRLSGYGYYGIGTIFDNKTYHLFQTRFQNNVNLLKQTANCILNDDLTSINREYNCRSELAGTLPIEDDYGY